MHLLQGMKDACIDPNKAINTAKALRSNKVTVKMLKNSNHRLQEPDDIKELFNSLDSILADYKKEVA